MKEESAFTGKSTEIGPTGPTVELSAHGPTRRIPVLDGWRATSILLVLGSHLLPLGPARLQLNFVAGAAGMALFFTLSGFLITQFLAAGMPTGEFLARRLARILPLGWIAVAALLVWHRYDVWTAARNFLFIANLPPAALLTHGEHLWSLCVEMQFYVSIALICVLLGRRGLYLIPISAVCVTTARVAFAQPISIVTWHRIDEILAGGIVALIYAGWFGQASARVLRDLPVWPFLFALFVCSHTFAGPLQYLRPYAASFLVGASLSGGETRLYKALASKPMAYVAEISYALYVFHGMLAGTWLGTGDKLIKYLKRPFLLAATFLAAHMSTRYLEQPITRAVRKMMRGKEGVRAASAPSSSSARRRAA